MTRLQEKYRVANKMSAFQRRVNRGQRQHFPDSASQFSSYQSVSAAVHQANNKAPVQPIRMDEVDRIIAQLNSDEAQNPKPERLEDALLDDQPPSVYAPSSTPSNQSRVADEKRDAGPRTANSTEIRMISQAFMDSLRGQPAKSVAVPYLKNNSMFSQEDFNSEVKYNDCYRTRTGPIEGRYKKWLPICTSGDIQAAADRLIAQKTALLGSPRSGLLVAEGVLYPAILGCRENANDCRTTARQQKRERRPQPTAWPFI